MHEGHLLAISLRDAQPPSQTVYHLRNVRTMEPSAALDSRCGVTHQTELNRFHLKARTHCREESLAELVEDFELVGGLPTAGKKLCIHRKKPATLRYFWVPLPIHILRGQNPESALFAETVPIDLAIGRPAEARLTVVECATTLRIMTDQMRQKYDSLPGCHQLQPRDVAWLHNPQQKKGLTPKLQHPWQGPYTVIKVD